jgi:hypothetical protein
MTTAAVATMATVDVGDDHGPDQGLPVSSPGDSVCASSAERSAA